MQGSGELPGRPPGVHGRQSEHRGGRAENMCHVNLVVHPTGGRKVSHWVTPSQGPGPTWICLEHTWGLQTPGAGHKWLFFRVRASAS